MNELWEKVVTGTLTLALLAYTWLRFQTRHDKLEERVLVIEQKTISREELREMHEENQGALKEMRDQIVANEKRRHDTEHAILNVVNTLSSKAAAAEAVQKYRDTQNAR